MEKVNSKQTYEHLLYDFSIRLVANTDQLVTKRFCLLLGARSGGPQWNY